jgi:hypothetical protein
VGLVILIANTDPPSGGSSQPTCKSDYRLCANNAVRGVDGYSDFNTLHSGKENESVELLLAFNILALNGYGVAPFYAEDQSAAAARSSTGRNFPLPAACPLSEFLPSGPRPVLVSLYNAKFFIVYTSHAILGTCPTACAGHVLSLYVAVKTGQIFNMLMNMFFAT